MNAKAFRGSPRFEQLNLRDKCSSVRHKTQEKKTRHRVSGEIAEGFRVVKKKSPSTFPKLSQGGSMGILFLNFRAWPAFLNVSCHPSHRFSAHRHFATPELSVQAEPAAEF